jgi:hypothetical protein
MDGLSKFTIKNGDVTYTISKDKNEFLFVHDIGNKKDEFLRDFERFLSVDCPPIPPAEDISDDLFRDVIDPIEKNKSFKMDANLFFRFGKWATFIANFHACRGMAAKNIFINILGIKISRFDISYVNQLGYQPLNIDVIFNNILNKIKENKSLIVKNE